MTDTILKELDLLISFVESYEKQEDHSWVINKEKKKEEFRNYENNPRQKRVELFYELQHTSMTMEFVLNKRKEYLSFNKCVMNIWDMLQYLDTIIDDSDPDTNLTQMEHAIQTAESARKMYPSEEYDWLHVTCLIHDCGKILAVNDPTHNLKGDSQWCVVGDNFPMGCEFSQNNVFYDYFKNNKDYYDSKYNTKYGIYKENIGLNNIIMSWGHDEYMYHIAKEQSLLPLEALYCLRFHSFYPWHNKGDYMYLCDKQDVEVGLKWVKIFNSFDLYSKSHECSKLDDVKGYYQEKLKKYFPNDIRW